MNSWIISLRKTINYIYRSFENATVEVSARIVLKTFSIGKVRACGKDKSDGILHS